eukprot:scaffold3043_cov180-Amphora_coffeaeformis.AAC.3
MSRMSLLYLPVLDYDSSPESMCWNVGCTILPVGYFLLAIDSYFDLRWVLFPSPKTKKALIDYYTTILTPRALYPGYWFPVYVIYTLCIQCPTFYHYFTLAMFCPISVRYVGILRGTDTRVDHWWTVLLWRVLLAIVTTWNMQSLGCRGPANYGLHVREVFFW